MAQCRVAIRGLGRFPDYSQGLTSSRPGVREFRPDLRALFAAASTGEARFDVGEPDIIGPAVGVGFDVMGAAMIAAIDQHVADAGGAHFAERDFCV